MGLYGGKTWDSSWIIDKIYNNYTEMENDISSISIGRYVFIKYCENALSQDERAQIEQAVKLNQSNTYENLDQNNYFKNYKIDYDNKHITSYDRRLFRSSWNSEKNEFIPEEIGFFNATISTKTIKDEIYSDKETPFLKKEKEQELKGYTDQQISTAIAGVTQFSIDSNNGQGYVDLDALNTAHPDGGSKGTIYLVRAQDEGNAQLFDEYFWVPNESGTEGRYELAGAFGDSSLNDLLTEQEAKELITDTLEDKTIQDSFRGDSGVYYGSEAPNITDGAPHPLWVNTDAVITNNTFIPIVEREFSATIEINANIETQIAPLLDNIEITFGNGIPNYVNEWDVVIEQSENNNYQVSFNEDIAWGLGIAPTFLPKTTTMCRFYKIKNTMCGEWMSI